MGAIRERVHVSRSGGGRKTGRAAAAMPVRLKHTTEKKSMAGPLGIVVGDPGKVGYGAKSYLDEEN